MIPSTYFFRFFSRKEYAFVLDGSLWTLDYADKTDFQVDISGVAYSMQKGPPLHELEEDYFIDEKSGLDACIEEIVLEHERFEITTLQGMRMAELARFVIDQIIPSYNPHALGRQQSILQDRSIPTTQTDMPNKVGRRRKQKAPAQQLEHILPALLPRRYLFADNSFFELRNASSQEQRYLHFRGVDLCLAHRVGSLREFEQKYTEEIKSMLRKKALQGDSSIAARLRNISRNRDLIADVQSGYFQDAATDVGFTIDDDRFYVTQAVAPYTLESRRSDVKRYYSFPKAIIGIELQKVGKAIHWTEPIVMNQYKHPCLPNNRAMQEMCFGSYDFRALRQRGTIKTQVLLLLYESKKMLTSGYFGAGNPYNHLDDEQYREYRRQRFETKAPITNEAAA